MKVVFTGRAYNGLTLVKRDALVRLCERIGWRVDERVSYATDYLIASETDTQKARDARRIGVSVQDYAWFFSYTDSLDQDWRREWRTMFSHYEWLGIPVTVDIINTLNIAEAMSWRVECREQSGQRRYRILRNHLQAHAVDYPHGDEESWLRTDRYIRETWDAVVAEQTRQEDERVRAAEQSRLAAEKAARDASRPAARWGNQAIRRLDFDDI